MKLTDFLNMFDSFGSDLVKLTLWQNGKCLGDKDIGDMRYIKPEYMNTKVEKFAIPKRSHTLVIILDDKEQTK